MNLKCNIAAVWEAFRVGGGEVQNKKAGFTPIMPQHHFSAHFQAL
jgi:hypothetical protein